MAELVVEDGSGMSTSNAFASVEDFDAWCESRLYAEAQLAATTEKKEQALMMAARIIEIVVEYYGQKKTPEQALGFPRDYVPEPGSRTSTMTLASLSPYSHVSYFPNDIVPTGLRDANCELARELLKSDRTDLDAQRKGVESIGLGQGAISVKMNAADRKKLFTDTIELMLRPFGTLLTAKNQSVPVYRV